MKRFFLGDSKSVIVEVPDGFETIVFEYPLSQKLVIYPRRRFAFIRRRWNRLMNWTPSNEQLGRLAAWLEVGDNAIDSACKVATIAIAVYFAIEIASAFLPGGPVARIGGLR